MADLQGQLELALRKATWVDALTRDKDRLETLKEQLQRKVQASPSGGRGSLERAAPPTDG